MKLSYELEIKTPSPYVRESEFRIPGSFCVCNPERIRSPTNDWVPLTKKIRNPESWALESGTQLKESEISLTIGIRNPSSTEKKSGIRIYYCLGFPYLGRPNRINTIRIHSGFQNFFAVTF